VIEINMLGRFEIQNDGKAVQLGSRPASALLAYLALTRGTKHPREKLAGLFWPESTDQNARKNLRQALWRLRKSLGNDFLEIDGNSITFLPSRNVRLDTALVDAEEDSDLEAAVSSYQGELLPGFYEDWVLLERDRLAAAFAHKMHQLLNRLLVEKRWDDVLRWSEYWISSGQISEAAFRALMRAHAAQGERVQVERDYQRCVDALQSDIGVMPSEETQALFDSILSGEYVSETTSKMPSDLSLSPQRRRILLPNQETPFIGRGKEQIAIKKLLSETRLVTITGPGGIGKTRLAIKVAEGMAESFPHGCCFVSLSPVDDVDYLVQAIAEALKLPLATHEDPKQQLFRFLRKQDLLLLLDNFEHLLEGVGIINEVLEAGSGVRILVTSREKLNLQVETNFSITGLEHTGPVGIKEGETSDAIALFIQRAQRARPGFQADSSIWKQISAICEIVEGMPLAIELAAAWLHVLTVEEILEELRKGFDFLETDQRDTPDRHRSMRKVLSQSWDLLNKMEQDVFRKLSVFQGGFNRVAAERVAGATLQQLAALVNKSFLRHVPELGRFEIHELLRQYGREQLERTPGTVEGIRDKYGAFFADFMHERGLLLRGTQHKRALAEILADIENVRAAWRFHLERRDAEMLWKMIRGLHHVYWLRWWNYPGMELFREVAEHFKDGEDATSVSLNGLAVAYQSWFMAWLGLPEEGYEFARHSVEILNENDNPEAKVFALYSLSVNAYMLGKMSEERPAIRQMSEIARELGDRWLSAFMMFAEGMIALIDGDYEEAQRVGEANLALYKEIGDISGSTMPLIVLGHRALAEGEFEQARSHYLRCLEIAEDIGFPYSSQTSGKYLGKLLISTGELNEAEYYLRKSLAITEETGFVRDIVNLVYEFARLRVAQGRLDEAVSLLTLVVEHPENRQVRWLEGRLLDRANELLGDVEGQLPRDKWLAAIENGKTSKLDLIVADLLEGYT
jgi:predicted ATPase/DNA-binding SARP family transcriptional activator